MIVGVLGVLVHLSVRANVHAAKDRLEHDADAIRWSRHGQGESTRA